MLFQPTNIVPSSTSGLGSGTIDATQPLSVTWQVNGDSPMVAYQINIYQNNTASTLLYSTGRIALSTPFYGRDKLGNEQFYTAAEISGETLAASNIYNGFADGYKLIITQWWSSTLYIAQTSASAFITRDAPTLNIAYFPNPLTVKTYSFTANYYQAQGDALNWVRWQIAQSGNTDEPIYDTGNINTSELGVDYDGFFSGEAYAIRCQIQTANGVDADTGWISFNVSYTTKTYSGYLTACQSDTYSGVLLTLQSAVSVAGVGSGNYVITGGTALMRPGSLITWDSVNGSPMSFSSPNTIAIKGQLGASGGTMFSASFGNMDLSFTVNDDGTMVLTEGPRTIYSGTYSGAATGWWTVIIVPNRIYIQRIVGDVITTYSGAINALQIPILSCAIYGEQTCEYFWVENVVISAEQIAQIMESTTFVPTWGTGTNLLANFETGINAGNLDFDGYSIYREEVGTNTQVHVADIPLNVNVLIDFGVKSQATYRYRAYSTGNGEFLSNPLISNEITTLFWNWSVIECQPQTDGAEFVVAEYAFGTNVNTSEISNNNSPNFLINFTQYPLRQPTTQNYKSGTLNAYLGSVSMTANVYTDTEKMADEVYALSTTENSLYLKNRKGAIYKISVSDAIKMQTGDNLREQPYKLELPWSEIGAADNASIVALQDGALWPTDNVGLTSAFVDIPTGMLYWTTPDSYVGSTLILDIIGNLLQSTSGLFTPAQMTIDTQGDLYAIT